MNPFILGTIASAIFLWAGMEQIWRIHETGNADDFSKMTCFLWVVGLSLLCILSISTDAHPVFTIMYVVQTIQYIYLWRLVVKSQKKYTLPLNKGKLKVYNGGRIREKK